MRATRQILDDLCIDCTENLQKLSITCRKCPVKKLKEINKIQESKEVSNGNIIQGKA